MNVLDEIREVIQVPIKLIHVIRNPFDNIATMMLHAVQSRDAVRGGGLKVRASSLNLNTRLGGGVTPICKGRGCLSDNLD